MDSLVNELAEALKPTIEQAVHKAMESKKNTRTDSDLIFIDEAAELLGISKNTIYMRTSQKTIPFMKRGTKLYFSRKALLNWLETGRG